MKCLNTILVFFTVSTVSLCHPHTSDHRNQNHEPQIRSNDRQERNTQTQSTWATVDISRRSNYRPFIDRRDDLLAYERMIRSTWNPQERPLKASLGRRTPKKGGVRKAPAPKAPTPKAQPKPAVPPKQGPKSTPPKNKPPPSKPPASKVEAYQPGSANDVVGQARQQNQAQITCKSANDCVAYCTSKTPKGNHINTCDMSSSNKGTGVCKCASGPAADFVVNKVGEIGKALGDAACAVWQKGIASGLSLASMLIPGGAAISAAEKATMTAAKKAIDAGSKTAKDFNFCGANNPAVSAVDSAFKNIPI